MKITSKFNFGALIMTATLMVCGNASAVPFPGPDTFGYLGAEIGSNLRDIRSTGTQFSLGDDAVTGAIGLGFTFDFYGASYTSAFVSSNGFLTFDAGTSNGCCSGQFLGDSTGIDNLIAGLWEDLDTNGNTTGTMFHQTIGSEFIVGFYDVAHFPSSAPVTFEMILHDGSNNIELQYGRVTNESNFHTIGISNIGDTDALTLLNSGGPIEGFSNRGFCIGVGGCDGGDVPEPGTLALLGVGLFGLTAARRRNRTA